VVRNYLCPVPHRQYVFTLPKVDLKPLPELFRAAVLKILRKEGKIYSDFVCTIMPWRHVFGFNAHNGVKIDRGEGKGRAGAPWLGVPDFSNILIILRKSCYITILFVMVNAN
jgi:hypothetical protein